MMKKKLAKTKAMTAIMISLLLVMFNVVGLVNGQEVTPTDSAPSPSPTSNGTKIDISSPVNELNRQLTAQSVVAGVLLIVTGFIYCFFGRRVYHITLFILGAYIGSFVAYIALLHAEPATGYTSDPSTNATIILLVSIAIGFIVGLLFVCCATVAIWLLGALAGYALAVFILSLVDGGLIKNEIGRIVFIVVFVAAGLILTCLFEDTIIILATAFIGADALILGIDVFAKTGFYLSVRAFLDRAPYTTSPQIYGMLAGLLGLFIFGSFVQFRYYRHREFGPPRKGYNRSIGNEETPQQPGGEKKKSGYTNL